MSSKNKKMLIIIGGSLGGLITVFLISALVYSVFFSNMRYGRLYVNHDCCNGNVTNLRANGGMMGRNATAINVDDYDVNSTIDYGSGSALKDTNLTLEDMLTYAIQDEYLADATYQAIINKYGSNTVFSKVVNAENNHIAGLKRLFEENNIAIPADNSSSYVVVPTTLEEAYKVASDIEVLNIKMYDLFLNESLSATVRNKFESLKWASSNHLRAFERQI